MVSQGLSLLLDVTLKGTLLVLVTGFLALVFSRASAALRHRLWSLVLAGLLLLPLLYSLPRWQLTIPWRLPQFQVAPDMTLTTLEPTVNTSTVSTNAVNITAQPSPTRLNWTVIVLLIWLAGVLLASARLIVGRIGVYRLLKSAKDVDEDWHYLLFSLCEELNIHRDVDLVQSSRVITPMTWGIQRPVVLLPADADTWDEERRRVVLLHELAHIARWDYLWQGLASLSCVLYWFNPFVWFSAQRLRLEGEKASDNYVLRSGTKASDYAAQLMDLLRSRQRVVASPLAMTMTRRTFEGRLLAILAPDARRNTMSTLATLSVAVIVAGAVLSLAVLKVNAQPSTAQNQNITPTQSLSTPTQSETVQTQDVTPSTPTPSANEQPQNANSQDANNSGSDVTTPMSSEPAQTTVTTPTLSINDSGNNVTLDLLGGIRITTTQTPEGNSVTTLNDPSSGRGLTITNSDIGFSLNGQPKALDNETKDWLSTILPQLGNLSNGSFNIQSDELTQSSEDIKRALEEASKTLQNLSVEPLPSSQSSE
jgi:beta-lactamase regulating signal transducer with metallopeptidase domain